MPSDTNIGISNETWRRLNARKHPGESFDDVLQRLLDETDDGQGRRVRQLMSDSPQLPSHIVIPLANPATAGGDGGATITIAVEDPDTVLAVANALDAAQVFVVRSDPDGDDSTPPPFRPDVRGR